MRRSFKNKLAETGVGISLAGILAMGAYTVHFTPPQTNEPQKKPAVVKMTPPAPSYSPLEQRVQEAKKQFQKNEHSLQKTFSKISRYHPIIENESTYNNLRPSLLYSLIAQESEGNPKAVGKDGDTGLMQVLPSTAREDGITQAELFDPRTNIRFGSGYLSKQRGDIATKLAGYNYGPGNIRKIIEEVGSEHPDSVFTALPTVVQKYVVNVLARAELLEEGFEYPKLTVWNPLTEPQVVAYRVQSGDTYRGIARKHGTDIKVLDRYNTLKNRDELHVGQKIMVPGK